jgi:cytochrome P450
MSASGNEAAKAEPTPASMDPPAHMQQRSMSDSMLTWEAIQQLRPHIQAPVG